MQHIQYAMTETLGILDFFSELSACMLCIGMSHAAWFSRVRPSVIIILPTASVCTPAASFLFQLTASRAHLQVDARQLPPPELVYKDASNKPRVLRATTGSWDLRGLKFHSGADLKAFAVASFDRQNGQAGGGPESEISVEVS